MICIRRRFFLSRKISPDQFISNKAKRGFIQIAFIFFMMILNSNTLIYAQSVPLTQAIKDGGEAKVDQDENGVLHLDFKNVSLLNVLNSLAEVSDINFVAGNEIAGREVNMSLDGVTLRQALEAISQGSNVTYDFMPDTNIITFRASSDSASLSPLFTRVFKLYFLRASPIETIDAGVSSGGGSSGGSGGGSGGSSSGGGGGSSDKLIIKVIDII